MKKTYKPHHGKRAFIAYVNSIHSDKPVQSHQYKVAGHKNRGMLGSTLLVDFHNFAFLKSDFQFLGYYLANFFLLHKCVLVCLITKIILIPHIIW